MWEIYAYQNAVASLFGSSTPRPPSMPPATMPPPVAAVAFCASSPPSSPMHSLRETSGLEVAGDGRSDLLDPDRPQVTVGIVDKTGGTPVQVVDNVPSARPCSATSPAHHRAHTDWALRDGISGYPGIKHLELRYEQDGLMFGNRLIRKPAAWS